MDTCPYCHNAPEICDCLDKPPAPAPCSAPITDAHRLDALERLFLNCPHATIEYDEEEAFFVLRVEGCEVTEHKGNWLREVLDKEVIYQREWSAQNANAERPEETR